MLSGLRRHKSWQMVAETGRQSCWGDIYSRLQHLLNIEGPNKHNWWLEECYKYTAV
jgi:hypothetical protein